jgi:50S ribosomal protein L16 3-hydroxylase
MQRHWQRKPLLVRQAWPGVQAPIDRRQLFDLVSRDEVESRCIEQRAGQWRLRHGPMSRRSLPPLSRPGWTLLVQGLDLHLDAAHDMLRAFDFIAQARLDDLMLSYASDGGGVGPHVDSYDVFLLQVQGRRRWQIAPPGDEGLLPGLPLRILSRFEPQQEWVLEPGDMLYLPPGWGHDGVAQGGDCMTASIGFRAPRAGELAAALLQRMADELTEAAHTDEGGPWVKRHADPGMAATASTGAVPQGLEAFAHASIGRATQDKAAMARALGAWLTEPKPKVWFEANAGASWQGQGVVLDRRTRMAYDERHLFINGEAFRVGGLDSRLLRRLADDRRLDAKAVRRLSPDAREAAFDWVRQGWLHLNQ